jgi:hypothetical protein
MNPHHKDHKMMMTDITERIRKDPLALAIVQVTDAMRLDYGRIFSGQIRNEAELKEFRRNLYVRLSEDGFKAYPEHIYPGYKLALAEHPKYCPNTNELVACINEARKRAKVAEKNRREAERVALAPPLNITREVNPIAMLRAAMAQIALDEHGFTKEQRHGAHLKRLAAHEKLMADYQRGKRLTSAGHSCSDPCCGQPGTLSRSTVGGGNYYCREHFMKIL